MSSSRWNRIEELFHRAADLPLDQRATFLEDACKEDHEMRRDVEALLGADDPEQSFLQSGIENALELLDEFDDPEPTDGRIGPYAIRGLIGKGGMGAVYRGVRDDDGAEVAIKLLRRGAESRAATVRFRTERRILAGLRHPNIAAFLDAGVTGDGRPYLVMEYVEGAPLLDYARALPVRGRLELFRSICAAVQCAHDHQIVHRDIKPGNVLVTADGMPKLLDFGIAKLLDPGAQALATVALTGAHTRLMTPEYASPEQVRGEPVTPATDVYALGAVLYELLTGARAQNLKTYSPEEFRIEICTREPVKPSAVRKDLDSDLDNIVLKALRKEPERRYGSAEEFSGDVGRFLQDLPVRARPESRIYKARKFAKRNRAAVSAAVITAILALAGVAGLNRMSDRVAPERSIAVLPFENLSGDAEQEYFADGLTDALIENLAQIGNLRVISRTSSMTFKGKTRKLPDVARSLGVRTIAEGSVARAGNRVRLAVRLVDASEDRPMWSASYEGEMAEVLALQDQVTADVARGIGVTLSGGNKNGPAGRRRVDLGAYDAYLKGRHAYFSAFTEDTIQRAIGFFQQALERDSGYAPAYAGIADCYYMMSNIYYPPSAMMPKARAAAEKAIQLDGAQAQAHATRALVYSLYEFDRSEADKGFRTAIGLRPGDALVHLWYGLHLAGLGRFEESVREVERARQLDPISPSANAYIGMPLLLAGRYDEVIQRMQAITDAHPEYHHPYAWMALAYEQKREYDKAVAAMERAYRADGQTESLAQLGHVYAVAGRTGEARKVLRQLGELGKRRYVPAYNIALMHAGLGDRDEAFRWLEKAWEDRSEWFAFVGVDPRLTEYRSDPRFASVLRNAGLLPGK